MTVNGYPIISLRGVTNAFGNILVHENLRLDAHQGEILGIIGASGSGKSVLMRTMLWLLPPREGEVRIMGHALADADDDTWREIRRSWGVLFQDGALFSSLTVSENIQVPLKEFTPALSQKLMTEIAAMKIHLVGLPPTTADLYPSQLSGGMRKRAGLARALALDPSLLFLDEPTAGLDPPAAAAFDDLLLSLREALGLTICLVTHDVDTIYAVCDRVAVLAERRIYAVGTIAELLSVPYPWIQQYFSGPRGRAARNAGAAAPGGKGA